MQAKTRLFLFLFWLPALSLHAQNVDSLSRLLRTVPPDTHRVSVLAEYAWDVSEIATDTADTWLQEAVALAQKLKFVKGEATAWNGLGVVEEIRGNLPLAITHYNKALALREQLGDARAIAATINNLGVAHENLGEYDQALAFHRRNLAILEQSHDTIRIARAYLNIAGVYEQIGAYPEAFDEANKARYLQEAGGDDGHGLAKTYTLLGHVRFELEMFDEAARWYRESLHLRQKLDDPGGLALALNDLGNALDELADKKNAPDSSRAAVVYYEQALKLYRELDDEPGLAAVYNNLGTAWKRLGDYPRALYFAKQSESIRQKLDDQPGMQESLNTLGDIFYRQKNYPLALDYIKRYYAIAQRIGDEKFIQKAYKDFAEVYAAQGDYRRAFLYQQKYDELRYRRLNERSVQDFERREGRYTDQSRQHEIERQQSDLALRDAKIARTNILTWALIGGALALAALAALLFNRNRLRARANRDLATQNAIIEQERERADRLLYNILPAATAEELKTHDTVQPVRYESATVMFTDFEGFTRIAERLSPEELVGELNDCFLQFDAIVARHGLEKIKTIGDAYLCAGGLPLPNDTHPVDVVQAALEMQAALEELMARKQAAGRPVFAMRIGIHTGPVVAGVVGSHKFAYDIWGDTVNTAARLEQAGVTGRVNISETTYQLVKHRFRCTFRGEIAAKNKGEIAMWFVEKEG